MPSTLPTPTRAFSGALRSAWSQISCVVLAFAVWFVFAADTAKAKTPGKTYCFLGKCHRVLTLAETRRRIGRRTTAVTSFYKNCKLDRFNPCGLTSSGAVFRPGRADNAASPIYPNGTKLLVWNPRNKRAAVVRIDNAGPYWGNRTLDLSRAAADRLGFRHKGVARLVVQVISAPTKRQATYRRRRVYPRVRGYIGRHKSIASAASVIGSRSRRVASIPKLKKRRKYVRVAALAKKVAKSRTSIKARSRTKLRKSRLLAKSAAKPASTTKKRQTKVARLSPKRSPKKASQARSNVKSKAAAKRKQAKVTPSRSKQTTPRTVQQTRASSKSKPNTPINKATTQPVAKTKPAPAAIKTPVAPKRIKLAWRRKFIGMRSGGS